MKISPKEFVKTELAINPERLSGVDQCRLARYILWVMAIDTPRISAAWAREIEWPEGEEPK